MADLIFGNNPTKKYPKEFKEYLINQLKISAQTIIDNAEEIIGDYAFVGDLGISFNMCLNKSECIPPKIYINKEYFPDLDCSYDIYNKMQEKEREKYKNVYPPEAINNVTGEMIK